MKLLHLGDLHIGKSVNEFSMIEDQRYILDQIIGIVKEEKINIVLIAGDVYDKTIPSEDAVKLLDYFLGELSKTGAETFLISGNHDSEERLNFGSSLFPANKIYIAAKYNGSLYKKECEDTFGKLNIYLLPFIKASQVKHLYPEEKIESYDDAVKVALKHTEIDPAERNVLVAHQFVAGQKEDPKLGGSEGASVLKVGTVEKISTDCFEGFDYVALGHIHSPQKVCRENIRYSGSPLKYSLSEAGDEKSVPVITLGKKGEISVELIGLKPLRDMRHIKGRMKQLLDPNNIESPEDYIYVTLTDEEPITNAMGIFQQHYKNTMKINYDNAHTREMEQIDITKPVQEKSYSELISDFYAMMYGTEISDKELQVMEEIAKEAGIINETN